MNWTELLKAEVQSTYAVTEKLLELVGEDTLEWRPSTGSHWMTTGQLLKHLTQGCGAAIEKLYVTPFGDVIPCPYMHISFGNVREASLGAIREKMLANHYLKGFHAQCLTAEDEEFMDKHLPRQFLQGAPLPRAEDVFKDRRA